VGLFHDAGQTIHLIDLRSGKPAGALHDPVLNATRAAFSDGDRTLVTLGRGRDARARIWDVARRTELRQIALKDDRPSDSPEQRRLAGLVATASAVSPDGRWIVCDSQKGYLRLLDTATGAEVRTLPGGRFGNSVFAFSPDGRTLARTGRDEAVHLIELATGKERHTFTGHRGRPVSLAFSRDGTALVSGSQDSTALVWDLTGRRIAARSLSPRELDASWADLLGDDAAKAYVAVRALAASAPGAVAYLESRLHPAAAADGKWVAALIADLDNDSFAAREKAESELDQLGEAAGPACTKALAAQPSAEARRRLEAILRKHTERERNPTGENLRALRALEVLEMIGSPPARRILESLARGLPGARITEEAKASRARLGAN
jgi:dipeptidyl aminopeptidase/acylaminoacyl peptidase